MENHTTRSGYIRMMFDRIADRYDLANHLLSMTMDIRWRAWIARHIPPPDHGTVLDVCCGTGDSVFVHRRNHVRVLGVDFSHRMLVRALQKEQKKQPDFPILWVEGDALELPVKSESIDQVTIAFGLRNLVEPERGIREFHRVLRSGGSLIILEFTLPRWPVWRQLYSLYLTRILPIIGGWIAGDRAAYDYLAQTIRSFPHYDDLIALVESEGFRFRQWRPFFGGVATAYHFIRING